MSMVLMYSLAESDRFFSYIIIARLNKASVYSDKHLNRLNKYITGLLKFNKVLKYTRKQKYFRLVKFIHTRICAKIALWIVTA